MSGSKVTTMGNSRTLLNPTASATSRYGAPPPSVVIRITWPGPTQTSRVDSITQMRLKPKSWPSAPTPI